MPEEIVLDTSVMKDIGRGNQKMADAFNQRLARGDVLLIPLAMKGELTDTRFDKPRAENYTDIINQLILKHKDKVKIAPPGPPGSLNGSRGDFYADNIQYQPPPKKPGQPTPPQTGIKEYGARGKTETPRPGDAFIVANAKALNKKLWVVDEELKKKAPIFGVQLAPECSIKGIGGTDDPERTRRLLGLPPFGNPPSGGGGKPPTPAHGGKIGPGLASAGKAVGSVAKNVGWQLLISYIRGKIHQQEIDEQLKKMEPRIQRLAANRVVDVILCQREGKPAWCNVTISVDMITGSAVTSRGAEVEKEHGPFVHLKDQDVVVSANKKEGRGATTIDSNTPFITVETTLYTFSFPMEVSSEELRLYEWFRREIAWCEKQLEGNVAPEDFVRLSADKIRLQRAFNEALDQSTKSRQP